MTVGVTREEMQRTPSLMVPGAPMVGTNHDVDELTALFRQLVRNMHESANNPPPIKRYPTVLHTDDLPAYGPTVCSV